MLPLFYFLGALAIKGNAIAITHYSRCYTFLDHQARRRRPRDAKLHEKLPWLVFNESELK